MSSPQGRQTGSFGDELTNALMIGLVGVFALALILRAAGSVAAFVTGAAQPAAGPAAGALVLFAPNDPGRVLEAEGLNPVVYWIVTVVLLAALTAAIAWVWTRMRRHTRKTETDPRRLAGVATRHEVAQAASETALMRRGGNLRPSLEHPKPADIGYRLGRSRGHQVWASVEDSMLLLGPPRSGKGLHVVIPFIVDAPGAVVTTSTRPDNLTATLRARERVGPVAVFDPQHLAEGVPAGMRWSPIRGCQSPLTAMIRATGLAASTGLIVTVVPGMLDVASMSQFLKLASETMEVIGKSTGQEQQWDFVKFLITRYEPSDGPQTQMASFLRHILGKQVLINPMLKSTAISDAGMTQQTIYEVDPKQLVKATLDRALNSMNAAAGEIEAVIQEAWGREWHVSSSE